MKRHLLFFMTIALSAAGCGGVKTGSADDGEPGADHRTDGGPDDGLPDGGGPDGEGPDGGGGSDSCVLGTSQLAACRL
ncbi:MAG TPA: hypothetical protein VFU21_17250 [Kofleriaceae bacterium]|nr:hypothetical protein [Kofleriaceae bacterium]